MLSLDNALSQFTIGLFLCFLFLHSFISFLSPSYCREMKPFSQVSLKIPALPRVHRLASGVLSASALIAICIQTTLSTTKLYPTAELLLDNMSAVSLNGNRCLRHQTAETRQPTTTQDWLSSSRELQQPNTETVTWVYLWNDGPRGQPITITTGYQKRRQKERSNEYSLRGVTRERLEDEVLRVA